MHRFAAAFPLSLLLPLTALGQVDSAPADSPTPATSAVISTAPLTAGERIVLRSEILGEDVSMNLYLPKGFSVSSPDHTYPVLFANGAHGEEFFTTLVGIVELLASRERMPETIVVSLNDIGAIPTVHTNGMWRAETLGGGSNPRDHLLHLEHEVIPFLEGNYRANGYRLILGVSGSSLFPIYTFTEAPHLFKGHILIAAADTIGMGYAPGETFIDAFEAALRKAPERRAKLYLATAEGDLDGKPDYVKNLEDMRRRLGSLAGMELEVDVFPETDHYGVFLEAVRAALDQSFPKAMWSARYRDLVAQPGNALENIDAYYRDLSARYGFEILPRADRWNNVNNLRFMTRHLIGLDRASEAVDVAKRRVEYRPREAGSYSGLADALEAQGDLGGAVGAQGTAVLLARTAGDPGAERAQERLDTLRTALAQEAALAQGEGANADP
ncbi:MAG: alpha/beta hydrolase-fold protein [Acidobacteriota bacterium]